MDYSFIIRRAVISDAPDVYAILQKAFREYADASDITDITVLGALNETIFDVEKEICEKVVYIAIIDNNVVGTIRVDVIGETANISRFAVISSYRSIGIGKSLMNIVDKHLISKGVKKVFLYTASRYQTLMRFYYGRGFYVESVSNDRGYPRAKLVKEYI